MTAPAPPQVGGRLQRTGAAVAPLLLNPSRWIYRRVESVEFIDDTWVRRHVSVDFELPPFARSAAYGGSGRSSIFLAPLALLGKRGLRHFDVRDENGRPLPLLTRDQNVLVATSALVSQAHVFLQREYQRTLEQEIALDLSGIAGASEPDATIIRSVFDPRGAARINRELLARDPQLTALAGALLENFIVLAPVRMGARRVIKYAYDEPLPPSQLSRRRVAVAFGWKPYTILWKAPSVGLSRSYHLEVAAPPDLEIIGAKLTAGDLRGNQYSWEHGASGRRSHLHAEGMSPDSIGFASVDLRMRRPGLLRASVILGVLTSALVTAGAFRIPSLEQDPASSITLLAVLPAILAAYLTRPGEHQLASTLLTGVRLLIVVVGLVGVLAAATLVADLSDRAEEIAWVVYAGVGWLATSGLVASLILPRTESTS